MGYFTHTGNYVDGPGEKQTSDELWAEGAVCPECKCSVRLGHWSECSNFEPGEPGYDAVTLDEQCEKARRMK